MCFNWGGPICFVLGAATILAFAHISLSIYDANLAFAAVVVGTAHVLGVLLLGALLGPIFGRVHLARLVRARHRIAAQLRAHFLVMVLKKGQNGKIDIKLLTLFASIAQSMLLCNKRDNIVKNHKRG